MVPGVIVELPPPLACGRTAAAQQNVRQAVEAELSGRSGMISTTLPEKADAHLVLTGDDTVLSSGAKAAESLRRLTAELLEL